MWTWIRSLRAPRLRSSTANRPTLEAVERRELLSGSAHQMANRQAIAAEISRYRVFSGSIPQGHGKTLTIQGPILLGPTDARGQLVGAIYNADGSRDGVVGLAFGGEISLQITTPQGKTLHAAGTGTLQKVAGGIDGYYALVGKGNLATVRGPVVLGHWTTSKAN